jgi:hypothetical protein
MTYSLYDTITVQQWTKNKNEHIYIIQTSEMRKNRQCIHVQNEYILIIAGVSRSGENWRRGGDDFLKIFRKIPGNLSKFLKNYRNFWKILEKLRKFSKIVKHE